MAEVSKIEWTDATFNPWIGCTKISPACDHCYAESWAKRTGNPELWQGERRRTSAANWRQPLKWNAKAAAEGRRIRVFCASLADVFDNQVPAEWRADLFALIRATPALEWLLLTKRPQNIRRMLPVDWGGGYRNVALGITAEDQERADQRVPILRDTPAVARFVSAEPLLGPMVLEELWGEKRIYRGDSVSGFQDWAPCIDWVIVGGEGGPGARPMHPDWARSIRDQCAAAGVPFLFKQWGEWAPSRGHFHARPEDAGALQRMVIVSSTCRADVGITRYYAYPADIGATGVVEGDMLARVGKKASGRHLDGALHDGFPV